MKKVSLVTLLVLVVAIAYKFHDIKSDQHYGEWETFEKSSDSKSQVVFRKSTKKELKVIAPVDEAQKRVPSSLPKTLPKVRKIAGREITGERDAKTTHLKWVNSYNQDWKEILGASLLRFQGPDTKVLVKKNKSVVEIRNGKGRLLEHVTVSFLHEGDDTTSFNAWVDSETGELVRTWNKTIKEPVGHHHERPILTPTGTL